jgi:hypothetical protein
MRGRVAAEGWFGALREVRADLRALARWSQTHPDSAPVAFHGASLLAPMVRILGFEVRPVARSPWGRLQEWYMRWLLAQWSPQGRHRLEHGHWQMHAQHAWLSGEALRVAAEGHDWPLQVPTAVSRPRLDG